MSDAPAPSTIVQIARDWGAIAVSVVALVIFLAAIWVAWQTKDPSLQILLGIAGANATTVVSFWVGSSSGSAKKDEVIAAKAGVPPLAGP